MYGSGESVEHGTPPLINVSGGQGQSRDDKEDDDSTIELDRPGEEKKNRCEANIVAKSGVPDSVSESDVENSSLVRLCVMEVDDSGVRSYKVLKFFTKEEDDEAPQLWG